MLGLIFIAAILPLSLVAGPLQAPFLRGDANGDGRVNISDPVYLLDALFLGGPAPACGDAADADDDGVLDLSDAVGLLRFLFLGGEPPPSPGPRGAGWDATPGDPFTCGDFPDELILTEDETFDRLTANAWYDREDFEVPHFPTLISYDFRRAGSFRWVRVTDVPEGASSGAWNFQKTTAGGGMLVLEDGRFLRFSFTSDGVLRLASLALEPCPPGICADRGLDCDTCTRADLPAVALPPDVGRLTAGRWRRTDDFNRGFEADTIEFSPDGKYTSVFRSGACVLQSFWSLGWGGILQEVRGETCDVRGPRIGGPYWIGSPLEWDGESLLLGSNAYLPDRGEPAEGGFRIEVGQVHGSNAPGSAMEARYARPLAQGVDTFRFVLRAGTDPIAAWCLKVSGIPLRLSGQGGYIAAGDRRVLANADLPALLPGDEHSFSLDLDLRGGEDLEVEFQVEGNEELWLFPSTLVFSR